MITELRAQLAAKTKALEEVEASLRVSKQLVCFLDRGVCCWSSLSQIIMKACFTNIHVFDERVQR